MNKNPGAEDKFKEISAAYEVTQALSFLQCLVLMESAVFRL